MMIQNKDDSRIKMPVMRCSSVSGKRALELCLEGHSGADNEGKREEIHLPQLVVEQLGRREEAWRRTSWFHHRSLRKWKMVRLLGSF